jgi:hypothetical protein
MVARKERETERERERERERGQDPSFPFSWVPPSKESVTSLLCQRLEAKPLSLGLCGTQIIAFMKNNSKKGKDKSKIPLIAQK